MIKEIKFKIENITSETDRLAVEAELEVLDGVNDVFSMGSGDFLVKFNDDKISAEEIKGKIRNLGFKISEEKSFNDDPVVSGISAVPQRQNNSSVREHVYSVKGMHCASCEILIEKKLLKIPDVKSVEASANSGEVVIEYQGNRPNPHRLNSLFGQEHYTFFDKMKSAEKKMVPAGKGETGNGKANPTLVAFNIAIFIIIAFLFLQKIGIADFLSISSKSSFMAFLGFGLLAGLSSCAALVGGIVLSMSKQWQGLYGVGDSTSKKLQPHIMFNAGRVISYAVLGGVLGILGSKLQISPQFTGFLIVAISFLMIALGLQMLGVKSFRKFQLTLPKAFTRYAADENNFQGKQMPFIMGALTFFLPCGFTITAQSLALLSGNAASGALIMGAFALGTVPSLLFIGLSSVKFSSKPHLADRFSKVAGFLVLFFALFNMSNQMNVLGFTPLETPFLTGFTGSTDTTGLSEIIDGKQVIKMTAYGSRDVPNYFKVRTGIPVRWEITADETAGGCNGSIISNSLFSGSIDLIPGEVSVKEFTPERAGKFRFSCQMGMISGIIEVVNVDTATNSNSDTQVANVATQGGGDVVPSGSKGCGCGGGSGSCGGN